MQKNRLYCDDNLEVLATMEAESVGIIGTANYSY